MKTEQKTNYGTSMETTPSSGPYKFEEWIRDQNKIYVRNEYSPMTGKFIM